MPDFTITDPHSGRTVTVSGDTPPTQQDADQIFQHVNASQPQKQSAPSAPSPTQQQSGGGIMGMLQSAGNFLAPQTTKAVTQGAPQLAQQAQQREQGAHNIGDVFNNAVADTGDFAKTVFNPKLLAEIGSYATPAGAESLLGRLGLGALGGGLSGASQDGATPQSIATSAVTGGVVNGASPLAGKVLQNVASGVVNNPVTRKLEAPFANSYNPEIDALAQKLGINLPVSATTTSKVVKGGSGIVERGTFFGNNITKQIAQAHQQLDQNLQDITASVNTNPDFKGAGDKIQQGFTDFVNNFNQHKGDLYDAVPQQVMQAKIPFTGTVDALKNIMEQKGNSLLGGQNSGLYQSLMGKLVDQDGNIIPQSLESLKQTRTELGAMIKNHADPVATGDKASLNQLYGALTDDLDKGISSVDPQAGQTLQDATNYYKDGINKINSTLGKKIASSDPETLVNNLIKPNSETTVDAVRGIIGDEGMNNLSESFLSKLYQNSMKDGALNISKLDTQLNKYGQPTLSKLLNPEQMQRLNQVRQSLSDNTTLKGSLSNQAADGSQTAYLSGLNGASLALLHNPLLFAQTVLGSYGASKLYTTNAGQKMLKGGMNIAQPVGNAIQSAKLNPVLSEMIQRASRNVASR